MYSEDKDNSESRFDETILRSARPVIEAELQRDRLEKDLKRDQETFRAVEVVNNHLTAFLDAKRRLDRHVDGLAGEVGFILDVTEKRPLPGVPVVLDGRAENTNFVANRLAAAEGQWFVPDKLLAEIWDAEVKEVNLIADRQSVVGQKIRQVIEIPCNLSSIKDRPQGGQGQANRFYSLDQALQLTTNRTVFADGWSRDAALSALRYGYEYRQVNGEPNPFRRRLVQIREQLNKIAVEKTETINGQREAKDRLRQLAENIRTLKADEHELGLVRESGLFSADELMRLGELTAATRQAREEAEARRRSHELEHVRLNAKREAYGSFKATHPDRSPEDVLVEMEQGVTAAQESAVAAEQRAAEALHAADEADRARVQAEANLEAKQRGQVGGELPFSIPRTASAIRPAAVHVVWLQTA